MMWSARTAQVDSRTTRTLLDAGTEVLTSREVITLWREDADFREFFAGVLRDSPFDGFFWEMPAMTKASAGQPFEFVLVQSTSLPHLKADPAPFSDHFAEDPTAEVISFPNLGGDATLIVPTPIADQACYSHLARFLQSAPASQASAFWQRVGSLMQERLSDTPVWLSTAGMGVSWLHLRLDSRPKYYRHEPYRKF